MTLDEAVKTTESFLRAHLEENSYFRGKLGFDDLSLTVVWVSPDRTANAVAVCFGASGEDFEGNPKTQALADRCLEAAKKAHPELANFKFNTLIAK